MTCNGYNNIEIYDQSGQDVYYCTTKPSTLFFVGANVKWVGISRIGKSNFTLSIQFFSGTTTPITTAAPVTTVASATTAAPLASSNFNQFSNKTKILYICIMLLIKVVVFKLLSLTKLV